MTMIERVVIATGADVESFWLIPQYRFRHSRDIVGAMFLVTPAVQVSPASLYVCVFEVFRRSSEAWWVDTAPLEEYKIPSPTESAKCLLLMRPPHSFILRWLFQEKRKSVVLTQMNITWLTTQYWVLGVSGMYLNKEWGSHRRRIRVNAPQNFYFLPS